MFYKVVQFSFLMSNFIYNFLPSAPVGTFIKNIWNFIHYPLPRMLDNGYHCTFINIRWLYFDIDYICTTDKLYLNIQPTSMFSDEDPLSL